ncbi:DegT/DnrJ/EryC1/StrS family aminotransferase [Cysteiniphilum halobium]|uniref:DegT/DnrJ/EryC1/StrS family aminotransferase n=1 Tax=Cysteiniphilum halobium TaxID=2219059 RepID=UPI003F8597F8
MFKIPSFKSFYTEDDVKALLKVVERSMFWADGPEIEIFEKNIEEKLEVKHALAMNSGTSALHALLLAIDVKGKEVICPSFTFVATANAIELAGGKVVFADSEPDTYGLDIEDVVNKINPNTKAVITLDYGGTLCRDTEKLGALCKDNNIFFIEDAAQSFGACKQGHYAGFYSDAAIFSFCQNKLITALGEGGAVVTNNPTLFKKMKALRSHGWINDDGTKHFESTQDNQHMYPGYNFRMPSASAAFANSQLKSLNQHISLRRANAEIYTKNLKQIPSLNLPEENFEDLRTYQMYTIRFSNPMMREKVRLALLENKILVKCYFEPLHLKKYYVNKNPGLSLPCAELLSKTVLTLPMFPQLQEREITQITTIIKNCFSDSKGD